MSPDQKHIAKTVRDLYAEDSSARSLFDTLLKHPRINTTVSIDDMLSWLASGGRQMSRGELMRVINLMVAVGAGDFVVGRRGMPSRFVFADRPHIIAGEASGATSDTDLDAEETGSPDATPGRVTKARSVKPSDTVGRHLTSVQPQQVDELAPGFIDYPYQLRKGVRTTFRLPEDLTREEAERIAQYVRMLPAD